MTRFVRNSLLLFFAASATIRAQETAKTTPGEKAPVPPRADVAITHKEAEAFAHSLLRAIKANDDVTDSLFDWDVFLQKTTADIKATEAERKAYQALLSNMLRRQHGMWRSLTDQINDETKIDFLHIKRKGTSTIAVYRLTGEHNQGLNYHEYPLMRGSDGVVRATDMFLYSTGESISELFRRLYFLSIAHAKPARLKELTNEERTFLEQQDAFRALNEEATKGDDRKVLQLFDGLPEKIRKDRTIMTIRALSAERVGATEFNKAVDEFQAIYPDDPALLLLAIKSNVLRKRVAETLDAIKRLDEQVGPDPYLRVIRASALIAGKDVPAGKAELDRAIELEPTLENAYYPRLELALEEKDHPSTLKLLKAMRSDLNRVFPDLTTIPDFADFVKSPEYLEWKRWKSQVER